MAGGGKPKKKSFIQGCLTSTVALIIFVYVGVLAGTALVKTFLDNNNGTPFFQVSTAAVVQPTAVAAQPQNTSSTVNVTKQQGSGAVGGSAGGAVSSSGGPTVMTVKAYSARYIVEQSDVTQNGRYLSFEESLQVIANKLLTTPQALLAVNSTTLANRQIKAGMVLIVPSEVVSGSGGGSLPNTGEYAGSDSSGTDTTDTTDNTDSTQ